MPKETNIVSIDLGARSYDIFIGEGLLFRLPDFIPFELDERKVFLITDQNLERYVERVETSLREGGAESVDVFTLKPGEQTKSFSNLERLTDWLLSHNVARDSLVVALGGGVVGDLAGFAAAVTLRGIPYMHIPTTLLAQVDSSVGGKTAINTSRGKNLVGAFYQPVCVVADMEVLKTLPRRELLAGYAEIVKYGIIRDSSFFKWLEDHGQDVCQMDAYAAAYAVEQSVKIKAQIVEADEQEQGQRALLNLGHTFGHALEAAAAYDGRLLHGEAVSIGMVMAMELSRRMGFCEEEDVVRVEQHLIAAGLPTKASLIQPGLNASVDDLLMIMKQDKKVAKGKMRFIVANGVGDAFIESQVPEKYVRQVLQDSLAESEKDSLSKNVMRSFDASKVRGLWRSVFSSHS